MTDKFDQSKYVFIDVMPHTSIYYVSLEHGFNFVNIVFIENLLCDFICKHIE